LKGYYLSFILKEIMWASNKKQTGFTIVELLIVIVVIAILAAISVVAYTGITERADTTRRVSAAREWYKRIQTYIATNNTYPPGALNNHACLGTGNPTDLDVNPDEDCLGTGNVKHPNTSLNNALATLGSFPSFPTNKLVSTSAIGTTAGISIRSVDALDPTTPNEKLQYPFLYYWLEGINQDCVLRPVAVPVTGGYTTGAAGVISTVANEGGLTRCMILLPDPARL
jgi:prepilin-type N-terminal cleavage/methylation domain-containing protein